MYVDSGRSLAPIERLFAKLGIDYHGEQTMVTHQRKGRCSCGLKHSATGSATIGAHKRDPPKGGTHKIKDTNQLVPDGGNDRLEAGQDEEYLDIR